MFLVYDQFKIDSVRFQTSNLYYMTKIDVYQEIFRDAKVNLEKQKKIYEKINNKRDSLKSDSLNQIRALRKKKPEKFNNLKVKPTI